MEWVVNMRSTKQAKGFTLVELLIVIVVIAILAAVSIVAYNGIQGRAHDTAIKSDLATVKKKLEMARIDNGHYPTTYAELPTDASFSKDAYATAQNNAYLCVDTVNDTFAFGAASKSGNAYIITSDSDIEERSGVGIAATCSAIDTTTGAAGVYVRSSYSVNLGSWLTPWND